MAADGQTATAVLHCTVEIESAIGPACTLVEMARQQGGGVTRHTERGVFELTCVKRDGVWNIQRAGYRRRHRLTRMGAVRVRSDTRCRTAAWEICWIQPRLERGRERPATSPSTAAYRAV